MVDVDVREEDRDKHGWHVGASDVRVIPKKVVWSCYNGQGHKSGQRILIIAGKNDNKRRCPECHREMGKMESMIPL